jgi:glycosyltransferase Alg8
MSSLSSNAFTQFLPKGWGQFSVYTIVLLTAISALPYDVLDPDSGQFLFVLGFLAVWRYGWGLVHYVRSAFYRWYVFPKWRKTMQANLQNLLPSHLYLLVTSFRIDTETTIKVFQSIIDEAIECGIPTTIVASIVELGDEFLMKEMFRAANPPAHIALDIVRIPGTGKRDGLAQAFRAISRLMPPEDSIVAVIDGDSVLEEGLVLKTVPLFKQFPRCGALTTDEECRARATEIFKQWYNLRFIQRHVLMGSMGLARKVLTLTGRMSMFRAEITCDPEFIARIENDSIDHWRLGKFKFLTGDDKSSWYHVLSKGWDLMYVPDTKIVTYETPPHTNFFKAGAQLMFRWYGNMLRTNGRALALGPEKIGLFTWWTIFDQRISMWTSLSTLILAFFLVLKHSILFLPIYLTWIAFTRWVMCMFLMTARYEFSWYYPFLLYYSQVYGAYMKTKVFFRLDKQSWTRQKTKLNRGLTAGQQQWVDFTSNALHIVAIMVFVAILGVVSGTFTFPTGAIHALF